MPVDNSLNLSVRSVMGVELPKLTAELSPVSEPTYPMGLTNSMFDKAYISFNKVKELMVRLAEVENCIYRLAEAIKKTQKRANALKNIMIPRFRAQVKYIKNLPARKLLKSAKSDKQKRLSCTAFFYILLVKNSRISSITSVLFSSNSSSCRASR